MASIVHIGAVRTNATTRATVISVSTGLSVSATLALREPLVPLALHVVGGRAGKPVLDTVSASTRNVSVKMVIPVMTAHSVFVLLGASSRQCAAVSGCATSTQVPVSASTRTSVWLVRTPNAPAIAPTTANVTVTATVSAKKVFLAKTVPLKIVLMTVTVMVPVLSNRCNLEELVSLSVSVLLAGDLTQLPRTNQTPALQKFASQGILARTVMNGCVSTIATPTKGMVNVIGRPLLVIAKKGGVAFPVNSKRARTCVITTVPVMTVFVTAKMIGRAKFVRYHPRNAQTVVATMAPASMGNVTAMMDGAVKTATDRLPTTQTSRWKYHTRELCASHPALKTVYV